MKTERAIELLKRISDSQFDGPHGDERREALEMAVRALFSQQIVNDSQGLVNDCISRKMAIDEVKRLHDVAWANWKETRISANTMIDALKDLPSAQPETHDKRTETHECDLINRQQAIDALNLAYTNTEVVNNRPVNDYERELYFRIRGKLSKLPSAQPEITEDDVKEYCRKRCLIVVSSDFYDEMTRRWASAQPQRKKGKWISEVKGKKAIIDEYGNVTCSAHCSECGDWLTGSDEYACRGRYCPSCGARMDGESDE